MKNPGSAVRAGSLRQLGAVAAASICLRCRTRTSIVPSVVAQHGVITDGRGRPVRPSASQVCSSIAQSGGPPQPAPRPDLTIRTACLYHHYLSVANSRRAMTCADDYDAAIGTSTTNGSASRIRTPTATCSRSRQTRPIQRVLNVKLNLYSQPGTENRNSCAGSRTGRWPSNVPVLSITGLDNFELPFPKLVRPGKAATARGHRFRGPGAISSAAIFRAAYYATGIKGHARRNGSP